MLVELNMHKSISTQQILWILLAAVLFCIPNINIWLNSWPITVLSLVCYAPFLMLWSQSGLRQSLIGGAILGASFVLVSSVWVWTYESMTLSIVLVVLLLAVILLAGTSVFAKWAALSFGFGSGGHVAIFIVVLAFCEWIRSISPALFLPLGSIAQAAAAPTLLPIANFGGTMALTLFVLAVNGAWGVLVLTFWQQCSTFRIKALLGPAMVLAVLLVFWGGVGIAAQVSVLDTDGEVWCASGDPGRRERGMDDQYRSNVWINEIARVAKSQLGCDLIAFPEYTIIAGRDELNAELIANKNDLPAIYVGALMGEKLNSNNRLVAGDYVTNSTCRMEYVSNRLICRDKVDKRYLAPVVEVSLFYDSPLLHKLGSTLTEWIMGEPNLAKVDAGKRVLLHGKSLRIGVITCLELFIPDLGRSIAQSDNVGLMLAPTDISDFIDHPVVLRQYQRAAALQAASSGVPVLFVSTDVTNLFLPDGRLVQPSAMIGSVSAWSNTTSIGVVVTDSKDLVGKDIL